MPGKMPFSIFISTPAFSENSFSIWFATTPAVFFSGAVRIVAAESPVTSILTPLEMRTTVTLSLGCSNARPKTSKPGPKLAVVAGAVTVILLNGITSSLNQQTVSANSLLILLFFGGLSLKKATFFSMLLSCVSTHHVGQDFVSLEAVLFLNHHYCLSPAGDEFYNVHVLLCEQCS